MVAEFQEDGSRSIPPIESCACLALYVQCNGSLDGSRNITPLSRNPGAAPRKRRMSAGSRNITPLSRNPVQDNPTAANAPITPKPLGPSAMRGADRDLSTQRQASATVKRRSCAATPKSCILAEGSGAKARQTPVSLEGWRTLRTKRRTIGLTRSGVEVTRRTQYARLVLIWRTWLSCSNWYP